MEETGGKAGPTGPATATTTAAGAGGGSAADHSDARGANSEQDNKGSTKMS